MIFSFLFLLCDNLLDLEPPRKALLATALTLLLFSGGYSLAFGFLPCQQFYLESFLIHMPEDVQEKKEE